MSAETSRADLASTLRDIAAVVTFLKTVKSIRVEVYLPFWMSAEQAKARATR